MCADYGATANTSQPPGLSRKTKLLLLKPLPDENGPEAVAKIIPKAIERFPTDKRFVLNFF